MRVDLYSDNSVNVTNFFLDSSVYAIKRHQMGELSMKEEKALMMDRKQIGGFRIGWWSVSLFFLRILVNCKWGK